MEQNRILYGIVRIKAATIWPYHDHIYLLLTLSYLRVHSDLVIRPEKSENGTNFSLFSIFILISVRNEVGSSRSSVPRGRWFKKFKMFQRWTCPSCGNFFYSRTGGFLNCLKIAVFLLIVVAIELT